MTPLETALVAVSRAGGGNVISFPRVRLSDPIMERIERNLLTLESDLDILVESIVMTGENPYLVVDSLKSVDVAFREFVKHYIARKMEG